MGGHPERWFAKLRYHTGGRRAPAGAAEELRLQHEVLSLLLQSESHRAERADILQRRAEVEQQLAAQSSSPNEGFCAQEPEPEWGTM